MVICEFSRPWTPRPRATDVGQGPHLHHSVHASLLRAPQPRARKKTRGRKSKSADVQENFICEGYFISFVDSNTRGLRRGGLTPACDSAHARNGRGCRQIEVVNAAVLPRGALRMFHACARLSRKRETDATFCTIRTALY